jgi:hypothetical protein
MNNSKLGWLLDRKVRGLGTFEDFVHVVGAQVVGVDESSSGEGRLVELGRVLCNSPYGQQ